MKYPFVLLSYFSRAEEGNPALDRGCSWPRTLDITYLVVEGCAASRAGVAADGGRVVHDPLVDEQAAAQLEQFAARGTDEAVVVVRRVQVGLVLLQGATRRKLGGRPAGHNIFVTWL